VVPSGPELNHSKRGSNTISIYTCHRTVGRYLLEERALVLTASSPSEWIATHSRIPICWWRSVLGLLLNRLCNSRITQPGDYSETASPCNYVSRSGAIFIAKEPCLQAISYLPLLIVQVILIENTSEIGIPIDFTSIAVLMAVSWHLANLRLRFLMLEV
jgi:hypothetical protein